MIQNQFKVVVPVYNAQKYIEGCLMSILQQSYKNYEMIVIDDASTDLTGKIIDKIQQDYGFRVIHRDQNVGALFNIISGINHLCKDDQDIILTIDGDDSLYHPKVFEYLNEVYQNQNIWLTYGQYLDLASKSIGCNAPIQDTRTYRKSGQWLTSHLRTFKWHLWKRIQESDLRDSTGRYYEMAWDLSFMMPCIEMAGLKRIKFISEILYLYNNLNPINDHAKDVLKQLRLASEIRNKPEYSEIL